MSLLEIDSRIKYILEIKRERDTVLFKTLGSIVFYGVGSGYASVKGGKNNKAEEGFHKIMQQLFDQDYKVQEESSPGDALSLLG